MQSSFLSSALKDDDSFLQSLGDGFMIHVDFDEDYEDDAFVEQFESLLLFPKKNNPPLSEEKEKKKEEEEDDDDFPAYEEEDSMVMPGQSRYFGRPILAVSKSPSPTVESDYEDEKSVILPDQDRYLKPPVQKPKKGQPKTEKVAAPQPIDLAAFPPGDEDSIRLPSQSGYRPLPSKTGGKDEIFSDIWLKGDDSGSELELQSKRKQTARNGDQGFQPLDEQNLKRLSEDSEFGQGKAKHLNAFLDSHGSTVPEEGASESEFDLTNGGFSEFSFSLGGSILQEYPRFQQMASPPPRPIELSQSDDLVQQQEEQGRVSFPFQGEQGIAMADADFQEMNPGSFADYMREEENEMDDTFQRQLNETIFSQPAEALAAVDAVFTPGQKSEEQPKEITPGSYFKGKSEFPTEYGGLGTPSHPRLSQASTPFLLTEIPGQPHFLTPFRSPPERERPRPIDLGDESFLSTGWTQGPPVFRETVLEHRDTARLLDTSMHSVISEGDIFQSAKRNHGDDSFFNDSVLNDSVLRLDLSTQYPMKNHLFGNLLAPQESPAKAVERDRKEESFAKARLQEENDRLRKQLQEAQEASKQKEKKAPSIPLPKHTEEPAEDGFSWRSSSSLRSLSSDLSRDTIHTALLQGRSRPESHRSYLGADHNKHEYASNRSFTSTIPGDDLDDLLSLHSFGAPSAPPRSSWLRSQDLLVDSPFVDWCQARGDQPCYQTLKIFNVGLKRGKFAVKFQHLSSDLGTFSFPPNPDGDEYHLEARGEMSLRIAFSPPPHGKEGEWKAVVSLRVGQVEAQKVLLRAYAGKNMITQPTQARIDFSLAGFQTSIAERVFKNSGSGTGFVKCVLESKEPTKLSKKALAELVDILPPSVVIPPNSEARIKFAVHYDQVADPSIFQSITVKVYSGDEILRKRLKEDKRQGAAWKEEMALLQTSHFPKDKLSSLRQARDQELLQEQLHLEALDLHFVPTLARSSSSRSSISKERGEERRLTDSVGLSSPKMGGNWSVTPAKIFAPASEPLPDQWVIYLSNLAPQAADFDISWPAHYFKVVPAHGKVGPNTAVPIAITATEKKREEGWQKRISISCGNEEKVVDVEVEASAHMPPLVGGNSMVLKSKRAEFNNTMTGRFDLLLTLVKNTGKERVYWAFVDDPSRMNASPAFEINPSSGHLSPDEEMVVTLAFRPKKSGLDSRVLTLLESTSSRLLSTTALAEIPPNTHSGRPQLELLGRGYSPQGAFAKRPPRPSRANETFYSGASELVFGPTLVGRKRIEKVRLCNASHQKLTVTVDSVTEPFKVDHETIDLRHKQGVMLPVLFCPKKPGLYQGFLVVSCSGGSRTIKISLKAEAVEHPLVVLTKTLVLSRTSPDETKLALSNVGKKSLDCAMSMQGFASSTSITLDPEKKVQISISSLAKAVSSHSEGVLELTCEGRSWRIPVRYE